MSKLVDDIYGDWEGIAPPQRGCFRPSAVHPLSKSRTNALSTTSSARTSSTKGSMMFAGAGEKNTFKVGTSPEEEHWAMNSKLISDYKRSKSVPPPSRWQRGKTVVIRENPVDKRGKQTKSSASTKSDDTDALLGNKTKLKISRKQRDDFDDRIDQAYIPPNKDQFVWIQASSSPIKQTIQSEKDSKEPSEDKKQHKETKTSHRVDVVSESSFSDFATSTSNPNVLSSFSKWKFERKNTPTKQHKNPSMESPVQTSSKGSKAVSSKKSPEQSTKKGFKHEETNTLKDENYFDVADLLSTNLKQMERDIQDLNKRKFKDTTRHSSNEQEYFLNKQLVQEQDDILLREQMNIPAEISLEADDGDDHDFHKDDGDTVSELGNESVTPKLNTSGLTLLYTDRAQRSNYVNDIDDTVEITEDTQYSSYHRGVGNHFNRGTTRRDMDYGPAPSRRTKGLTRFDNRGLPDISLIDSDSDMSSRDLVDDDLSYPLHSKGVSLTEAFNDISFDDRIASVRKTQRFEEQTDTFAKLYGQRKETTMKVGRRVVRNGSHESDPVVETSRSNDSSGHSALTRFLASKALRSNKYIETGGAIRLKRDHINSVNTGRVQEAITPPSARSSSTKRGTLPKGSFSSDYDRPDEYADIINGENGGYGSQRSRRIMRTL